MNQRTLHELLWQTPAGEFGDVFREFFRQTARGMLMDAMVQEVEAVCGVAYHPRVDAPCRRAGSAPGRVILGGRTEEIRRPRMRKKAVGDGAEEEVVSASYRAAQDPGAVHAALLRAIAAGVSTREAGKVFPGAPGNRSSTVSRLWVTEGRKHFAAFRARDLSQEWWIGIILDGIELAANLTAVAAVGVTVDGRKVVLDFEVGASENREACDRLLARVQQRNFRFGGTPLAVVDGSKALMNSLRHYFPDVEIQRCLVHKERKTGHGVAAGLGPSRDRSGGW